jgi:hypothetical protein
MTKIFRNPACTFLRKLISPYGYGIKDAFGYRRPTNEALLADYNRRGYIRGLTNVQMLDHFNGKGTYYFWGDGRIKTPYALICIDIDNHKSGTLAAAQAFARHLKDTIFPGLYFEPSTGGKGVHGYVLIDKRGFGDERLHGLGKMLDRVLKAVHKGWQDRNPALVVEGVEIKGHPPRITWTPDRQMKDLISGQFAKLPRKMLSRFEEFRQTTVLNDRQISQLYLKYKDQPVVSCKSVAETAKPSHSLTGCVVKQPNIDRRDAYLNVARTLVVRPLKTKGREVATAEDMAILLMILEACTNSMNVDGSMPTARIKENWEILSSNGEVERPWCPRRYTALRDHLSNMGYIDWEDRRYVPAALSPTGMGQAARWRAAEALMGLIEDEKLGLGTDVVVGEEGLKAEAGELGDVLEVKLEREEDLYYDKRFSTHEHEPVPDWIIRMRQPDSIRPVLDVGFGTMRMAA